MWNRRGPAAGRIPVRRFGYASQAEIAGRVNGVALRIVSEKMPDAGEHSTGGSRISLKNVLIKPKPRPWRLSFAPPSTYKLHPRQ